jgi:hypothetical protein
MIQNIIQDLGGIGIFGTISICLFLLVFGGALLLALRADKRFLQTMESLPLEDDPAVPIEKGDARHD